MDDDIRGLAGASGEEFGGFEDRSPDFAVSVTEEDGPGDVLDMGMAGSSGGEEVFKTSDRNEGVFGAEFGGILGHVEKGLRWRSVFVFIC
jgi:hypothetical protein